MLSCFSHVRLFGTLCTVANQALLSTEFSRQEYWSGSPFPSAGDLPDPGIESGSPALQADSLPTESPGKYKYQMGNASIKILNGGFPGSPVAKTLQSQCRGQRFDPCSGI